MDNRTFYFVGTTSLAVLLMSVVWSCDSANNDEATTAEPTEKLPYFNGPTSGAIFTLREDGSSVVADTYAAKDEVYLAGGPGMGSPSGAAGLPEGDYYFQVTDATGQDLLSSDHISCRKLHVNAAGVISQIDRGTNYVWRSGGWVETECSHRAGVDPGNGSVGALSVQLYPFDNTPNLAGIYKLWLLPVGQYVGDPNFLPRDRKDQVNGESRDRDHVHGFVAADAKVREFRIKPSEYRPQVLSVHAFHDANANGEWDADEGEIVGWEVTFDEPLGGSNRTFTPSELLAEPGRWALLSSEPVDARMTTSLLDGEQRSRFPEVSPLQMVEIEGRDGERHNLVFGLVGVGTIEACKIYDADGDGRVDAGEAGVAGWRFRLEGVDLRGQAYGPVDHVSEADGCARFAGLLPGRYTVNELSLGGDWVSSGPDAETVMIRSELDGASLTGTRIHTSFTNYCQGTATFGSIGYWRSKPGLEEISDAVIDYLNTLSPFKQPSRYFDGGDEPFDGRFGNREAVVAADSGDGLRVAATGSARAELSQFLLDPSERVRERMAQQLLAFVINIHLRVRDIGATIQRPDGSFISCDELISAAIAAWESDDIDTQTELERLLDVLNNSDAVRFIHDHPCRLP